MYCEWEGLLEASDPDVLGQWLGTNRARNVAGGPPLTSSSSVSSTSSSSLWISPSDCKMSRKCWWCLIQTVCPAQVSLIPPSPPPHPAFNKPHKGRTVTDPLPVSCLCCYTNNLLFNRQRKCAVICFHDLLLPQGCCQDNLWSFFFLVKTFCVVIFVVLFWKPSLTSTRPELTCSLSAQPVTCVHVL